MLRKSITYCKCNSIWYNNPHYYFLSISPFHNDCFFFDLVPFGYYCWYCIWGIVSPFLLNFIYGITSFFVLVDSFSSSTFPANCLIAAFVYFLMGSHVFARVSFRFLSSDFSTNVSYFWWQALYGQCCSHSSYTQNQISIIDFGFILLFI